MIREMKESDLAAVARLEKECFTSCWSEEQYRAELSENAFSHLYVLVEGEELIGYLVYWITFETAQLCKLAVAPAHRRKGHATALMEQMMHTAGQAQCEFITLEVRVSNRSAIALYERFGFTRAGLRKGYYQDNGEDAYVYACAIGGSIQ